MTDRFSPRGILRAHFAALSMRTYKNQEVIHPRRDWLAIITLYGVPFISGLLAFGFNLVIANISALLGAASLIAGALLAVFVQLSTSRSRFNHSSTAKSLTTMPERDLLDESVSHVLVGVYCSIALVIALAIHELLGQGADLMTRKITSAVAVFFGVLLVKLFLLIIPSLWSAYDSENRVPRRMGGSEH